jgi:XTP/dITP diphosphohydrolase
MKELIVATGNKGKLIEINELLKGYVTTTLSLQDFPDLPEVEEDGLTFEENAIKKAKTTSLATGKPVIADDSGLLVEALGGKPGVYSARFAGIDASDEQNNKKLLRELSGIPAEERLASFQCIIALYMPGGTCMTFSGELKGLIIESPRGSGGFGYDPLFLVREYGKTLSELPLEIKNRISHRAKALNKLKSYFGTSL